MNIKHHISGSVLIVEIPEGSGRLAGMDVDEFIHAILEIAGPPVTMIAFDFTRQEFLNSSGLGELVKIKDSLTDRNMSLALINLSPRVTLLVHMVGVDRFFTIVASEDELTQR